MNAAIRAALAADAPDIAAHQVSTRLLAMMGAGGQRTDLDDAVRILILALTEALHDDDVALLIMRGNRSLHDSVLSAALAWGYDVAAARRMASNLLPTVLSTLVHRVVDS
ncbi:hypothetical protein ACFU44_03685 [Nocardia rhizosphaerihabitans]|uniref:hypothetical protein n=1 Tax=Nocardia rhizosphaerihabitans TaxID=1691570 RepID=UPI00366A8EEA